MLLQHFHDKRRVFCMAVVPVASACMLTAWKHDIELCNQSTFARNGALTRLGYVPTLYLWGGHLISSKVCLFIVRIFQGHTQILLHRF